jgi:hypothetical protein
MLAGLKRASLASGLRPDRIPSVSGSGTAKSDFAGTHKETDMTEAIRTQTPTTEAPEQRASATQTQTPSSCCGGPAPTGADACCVRDAEAKATGAAGCGCASRPAPAAPTARKTGCCG